MNWYSGNISQAVKLSQQRNSIFVVYIEGNDELSTIMGKFINEDPRIKKHLESDFFLAIRIESGSEAYMQFAQIYKLVPSPSMFFIGKNGSPLEIATGIESADDLVKKIENVLQREKTPVTGITSANFISGEQASDSSTLVGYNTSAALRDNTSVVVTDSAAVTENTSNAEAKGNTTENTSNASENQEINNIVNLEKARKIIEAKRKEKETAEEKREREREVERRKLGKNGQSFKEKQKEEELQKLKEERIRGRLEEQIARQRILEKIANDKAERAHKYTAQSNNATPTETTKSVQHLIAKPPPSNSNTSRIQFRTPDGQIHTQTFDIEDDFQIIRNYVANTILDRRITDFQLATTFPKREFTTSDDSRTISELGLYPSALILIFCKLKLSSKPSAIAQQSRQLLTMFHSMFISGLSPIFAIFGYVRRLIMGNDVDNNLSQPQPQSSFGGLSNTVKGFFTGNKTGGVGAQKRTTEEHSSPNDEAKKRNINRLISGGIVNDGASTSNGVKSTSEHAYRRSNVHRLKDLNDSDDENATWNGNSTQQQ